MCDQRCEKFRKILTNPQEMAKMAAMTTQEKEELFNNGDCDDCEKIALALIQDRTSRVGAELAREIVLWLEENERQRGAP